MAALQTTYVQNMPIGQVGAKVNSEEWNAITRTADGTIPFGQPVMRTTALNCILASMETLEAASSNGAVAPAGATITAAPVVSAGAKEGRYNVTCILGGAGTASKWEVEDPDGNIVGIATGATAFSLGGLAFTIADAGTDPAVGEQFYIDVTPSAGTDDKDILGISLRDVGLGHPATPDSYLVTDNVAILTMGVIWVTAGDTVTAGQLAYWDVSDSRYTNTATHLPVTINGRQAKFDSDAVDGGLVKLAIR